MPEFTALTAAIVALLLVLGMILGWILRGDRCAKEKIAVNAGWQEQIESQQGEHDRLAAQNKSLMEQIGQYQASHRDSTLRAKELAESMREAFQRRDELQRQIKDIRGKLELAVAQRDRLSSDVQSKEAKGAATAQALKQRDEKIHRLSRELENWQSRVPPLIERYRERDEEARELADELEQTRGELERTQQELERMQGRLEETQARVGALRNTAEAEQTRIEPVGTDSLPQGLDASNEPHEDELENPFSDLDSLLDGDGWPEADDTVDPDAWLSEDLQDDASAAPGPAAEESAPFPASADEFPPHRTEPGTRANGGEIRNPPSMEAAAGPPAALPGAEAPHAAPPADAPDGESRDDLKEIRGVGPAIEKTLNDLGIYRFNQIAGMSEHDIDRVARQLKGFRSRIYREDWMGQARMLELQKKNSLS